MDDNLDWEVSQLRERYAWLGLTPEQALTVYSMEAQDMRPLTDKREYFSFWEQQDYDLDRWKALLDDRQMKLYEVHQAEQEQQHIAFLVERDVERAKEIPLRVEWVEWLRAEFVPGFQARAMQQYLFFHLEQEKQKYLRKEYRAFCTRRRQVALVNHYRQSKRWQPISLQEALLQQEEMEILPNFTFFEEDTDVGVRGVMDFLFSKYRHVVPNWAEFLEKEFAARAEQYREMRKKHFGEEVRTGGWSTYIYPRTERSDAEVGWMTYLLMEPTVRGGAESGGGPVHG